MPATANDSLVYKATPADVLAYSAKAADALANSAIVKSVTLSKNPAAYWRLNDSPGNGAEIVTNNPSFETGDLTGWSSNGITVGTDFATDGTHSAKVTGASGYRFMKQTPTLPVGRYQFTAWIKTDSFTHTSPAGLEVEGSPNGTASVTILSGGGSVPAGTADWTLYTLTFIVTVAGTLNLLLTNSYGGNSTGTIWFDSVHCAPCVALDSVGVRTGQLGGSVSPIAGILPGDPNDPALSLSGTTNAWVGPSGATFGVLPAFGVGAWVKAVSLTHAGGGNAPRVVQDASSTVLIIVFNNGAIQLNLTGCTPATVSTPINAVAVGALTHIAGSWDGSTGRIYVNGVLKIATPTTGVLNTIGGLVIGNASVAGARAWDGPLAEVVFFSHAPSDADWSDIYHAGANALGALATSADKEL